MALYCPGLRSKTTHGKKRGPAKNSNVKEFAVKSKEKDGLVPKLIFSICGLPEEKDFVCMHFKRKLTVPFMDNDGCYASCIRSSHVIILQY